MLKNNLFKFRFFIFIQTGIFIDFFIKKFIEIFVKNYLNLTANFFGEKFIIEYLTKKILDSWFFNTNKFFGFFELSFFFFFIQFISFIFFFIAFLFLFL